MKGIILAGGSGTRLHPITLGVSKQLIPVYDKPMVYYPLSTLMLAGIRDILVITTPHDAPQFRAAPRRRLPVRHLDSPSPSRPRRTGWRRRSRSAPTSSATTRSPSCWATTCSTARASARQLKRYADVDGGAIFAYWVAEPTAYGVVEFDDGRPWRSRSRRSPTYPKSNYAVPGLYFYDNDVVDDRPGPAALARAASTRSPTSTAPTSRRAGCRSRCCPAAPPGWTPGRSTR